jgi:putative ABC transport system permease protein
MLRNLIVVSLRNLLQNRSYTLLHILGLTLGITCALFITLYIVDEVSYDDFHDKRGRIYRIVTTILDSGKETNYPSTQVPMATELETKYTEVEGAIRFLGAGRELFENPDARLQFYEENFYFTDSTVFDVFTFPLIHGDPSQALAQPNTVVVTESTARRYFGTTDAIGKTILSKGKLYTVTGIAGNPPSNSSIRFDALLSFASLPSTIGSWDSWYPDTYVLINESRTKGEVDAVLSTIAKERVAPLFDNSGIKIRYWLQPLTDIHLKSGFGQDGSDSYEYILIFLAIGVFVILLACINYINLATARAARRAKEIGIRKTIGSTKGHIVIQFAAESTVLAFISLFFSIMLTATGLPYFNDLAGKSINASYLLHPSIVVCSIFLTVFIGLIGGSYPAFYLSRFNPALVLKGNVSRGVANARLRKVLVSTQFAISVAMLICTAVVYDQLSFMRSKDLGFNKDQVLHVELADSATMANENILYDRLKTHSNVVEVSSSSSMPGKGINYLIMQVDGPDGVKPLGVNYYDAGYDYVQTIGLTIVKGRGFSRDYTTDSTAALVNEAMVKSMKWDEPIGKRLSQDDGNPATVDRYYTVVGVLKDYHQSSLHSPIIPLAILFNQPNFFLNIKVRPDNIQATLDFIAKTWSDVTNGKPFSYSFLDADFQSLYLADEKRGQIFSLFSIVCLVISCVGLFGLAAYTTEQRTKEIGIRKVVGASIPDIARLFYSDILKLIAFGLLIAFPASYFVMDNWLQTFAYQTGVSWMNFLGSALITVLVTMISISFYAIRAAKINPASTLRGE